MRSGVAHITLYRNLTQTSTFVDCDFPITITRPLTIRGACAVAGPEARVYPVQFVIPPSDCKNPGFVSYSSTSLKRLSPIFCFFFF